CGSHLEIHRGRRARIRPARKRLTAPEKRGGRWPPRMSLLKTTLTSFGQFPRRLDVTVVDEFRRRRNRLAQIAEIQQRIGHLLISALADQPVGAVRPHLL